MVVAADPLAFPHIIVQIAKLILGKHIMRQDGVGQVVEIIPADHRVVEVDILAKLLPLYVKRHKAVVVKGIKSDGKLCKVREILA